MRQQPLGFQGQVLVPQVVVGHHRIAPVFLHSKNCHLVVHSFHLKFHRAVKGGELARLVGTFLIHTKLVLPVRAVETAGAAVLRRSGLAVVKMICARPRLHELFKGPVAAGSKVHRRSPPFCFWAQKSGVLISPKGKRERRCLRCRIQFSMCHYLGAGLHGKQKRVKAQSESSKSVVNSVLISREMPVFPGFLEIIRVVNITPTGRPITTFINLPIIAFRSVIVRNSCTVLLWKFKAYATPSNQASLRLIYRSTSRSAASTRRT